MGRKRHGTKQMLLTRTYLAASPIEGVGVFSAEPIAAGTLIWQLNPDLDRVVALKAVEALPQVVQEYILRYSFPHLEMDGYLVIDFDNGRFMNHLEKPNTDFTVFDKGYALSDIASGEEITCNYSEFDPAFTGFR
jgi:SET domain-containing protein